MSDVQGQKSHLSSQLWKIHGNYYNFDSFVNNHPGGKTFILLGKGRDCSELFSSVHVFCNKKPNALLEKYLVPLNQVKEDQKQETLEGFTWDNSGFYSTVSERVNNYIQTNLHGNYKANLFYWCKVTTLILLEMLFLYFTFTQFISHRWFVALCCGIISAQMQFCVMHDGNHGAISTHPLINTIFGSFSSIYFWDSWIWLTHHTLAHHSYTGIYKKDPDVVNSLLFARKSKEAKWKPIFKYQHILGFLGLMVLPNQALGQTLVYNLASKNVFGVPLKKKVTNIYLATLIHLVSFVFHFILPVICIGWKEMAIANVFYWTAIGSSYFFLVLPNHDTDIVLQHSVVPSKEKPVDWGVFQVRNSSNHSITNSIVHQIVTQLYGGMNYQIEHHLFPSMCHVHYSAIAPIVQQTCKEFNIPYNYKASWMDAIVGHYQLLKSLRNKN